MQLPLAAQLLRIYVCASLLRGPLPGAAGLQNVSHVPRNSVLLSEALRPVPS